MLTRLEKLAPGTAFVVPGTGLSGVLISCNFCRAVVRLATVPKLVQFIDGNGIEREFMAESSGLVSWAPGTEVEAIG